jgi:PAS domain S-box-containing protein/putative nucleotidyltransferase with HDIG domain
VPDPRHMELERDTEPQSAAQSGSEARLPTAATSEVIASAEALSSSVKSIASQSSELTVMSERLDNLLTRLDSREHELAMASAAVEYASIGLSIFNTDGSYLYVNEETCRRTGYEFQEFLGLHVWDVAPEFTPDVLQGLWTQHEDDMPLRRETVLRRKDGSEMAIDVSIKVMDFENQQLVVAFSVDLSERKAAEAALRESEQRFSHAFQGNPVSMALVDEDGIYLEVNRAWEAHTGYSAEEAIGHHVRELPRWAAQAHLDPAVDFFQGNALIDGVEAEYQMKSGETRVGLVNIEPLEVSGKTCILAAIEDITERKHAEAESAAAMKQLQVLTEQMIATMARLVEARDPYTAGHEQRVTQLSVAIAKELELDELTQVGINVAAQLHDLGKMVVPAEILAKPGKLSFAEFSLVKGHAKAGFNMLSHIDFPWPVAQIVLQHHERLDGSGYPNGLKRRDILPEARIIAVADVVEAMSAHRPYRPSLGLDAALEEVERGKGVLYDEAAVDACVRLFRERGFKFA